MVVNTSTGGAGGLVGLCSSVLDALTTSEATGVFTSSSGEVYVQSPSVLDEFMVRYFMVPKCVLRSIVSFCSVYACVKRPFLVKSCF